MLYQSRPYRGNDGKKLDFPVGTMFEYCKRPNLVVNLGKNYRHAFPFVAILVTVAQLLGALYYAQGSIAVS